MNQIAYQRREHGWLSDLGLRKFSLLPPQGLLQVLDLLQSLFTLRVLCPLDKTVLARAVDSGGGERLP